jgi:hypothetical protein
MAVMTSKYIDTVYTAIFYEKEPINEVGIYGYGFEHQIDSKMFEPKPVLDGEFFTINNEIAGCVMARRRKQDESMFLCSRESTFQI